MRPLLILALGPLIFAGSPVASRFAQNPLIDVDTSPALGDNVNGPSVIRVPQWVRNPLGRYYLYFAHHKGKYIRLAYADSLAGPWKIYDPGVLKVSQTEFYRPQPDPPDSADFTYTHVASPEVFVDEAKQRLVMWVHGMWTDGKMWPAGAKAASEWLRENGYAQFTQTAVSKDGVHFQVEPGISAKTSYLRVFAWRGHYYGMARLGHLLRTDDLLGRFESGSNPFDQGPYAGHVRHVGLLLRRDTLYVFFSAIGESPERILLSTIALNGDWKSWKASAPQEIIRPQEKYECAGLPLTRSKAGESEGRENALRDPEIFEERGRVILFYSVCGEQGIGAADVTALIK